MCVCSASKLFRDKCDVMKISFDIIPFWGRWARKPTCFRCHSVVRGVTVVPVTVSRAKRRYPIISSARISSLYVKTMH